MPSFCVVSNCEYKYASTANISFHKFPLSSPELLKKWIDFTDRGPDWFPSKWSSICSRHFLPSDFRIQHLRKCLKRSACPSVTMKSLDFNSIPATDFNESHYKVKKIICRLCARGGAEYQSKSILELNSTLIKCLPAICLKTVDNLPNEICGDCIKKLVQFSLFIDRVASVQKDLFGINSQHTNDNLTFNDCLKESATKPMIIKQEPIVNIKQEIFEFNKSTRHAEDFLPYNTIGQDYYADAESDAYCECCDVYFINNVELKNHIVDCHSDNPRERANNCEIMEIITLENAAFIDLDENCVEDATVPLGRALKVEKTTDIDQLEVLIQTISTEHNYARTFRSLEPTDNSSIVRNLKQEEMNVQVKSFTQTKPLQQQQQQPVEPIETFEAESIEPTYNEVIEPEETAVKCTKCNDLFERQTLLNEHIQTVHPKTKICPICTAHCRTIYHYFIHRSKYHNWSKPRRPKRKLRFKCGECSKMFMSKFAFDNHIKYSCASLRFKCSICQLEFSSGMSMLIHKRICKVLMAKVVTVDNITKVNKRMKIHNGGKKEASCLERRARNPCVQTTTQPIKSLRHQSHRNRMREDIDNKNTNVPLSLVNTFERPNHFKRKENTNVLASSKSHTDGKEYVCSRGKHYKSIPRFKAHESDHILNSQSIYICKICNKGFPIRSYLYQHLVTHDNERKHKCTLCTKVFKRLAGLNQHIRGYHYKIKPHVCTVCNHSYALKGDMRRCRHSTLQNKT